MSEAVVSVIIPTYNHATYLRESIESVQSQTVANIEIIVVDDGSTDNTQDDLASIKDARVRLVETQHVGVGEARNAGLAYARGEFIAFQDSDDRWRPTKLERQLEVMRSEPEVGVVFTNFRRFSDDARYEPVDGFAFFPELREVPTVPCAGGARRIAGDAFLHLLQFGELPTFPQTILFRTALAQGLRFSTRRIGEGLHFFMQLYRRSGVAYILTPLVDVRRHESNTTKDLSEIPAARLQALELLALAPLRADEQRALTRRIAHEWITIGREHAGRRRLIPAVRAYLRAGRLGLITRAIKAGVLLPYDVARQRRSWG